MYDASAQLDVRTVVSLQNAKLAYKSPEGDVAVLKGIDLDLREKEIVALTGPSGSGKSSLLAIMAGLEKATSGDVTVLGTNLTQAGEAELTLLRRHDIGVVFQSFHLVPAMSALQNAALPLRLAGDHLAEDKAAEILENLGLGHRLHHLPSALSGGEQQRVAIARAFAASPRLILADEPTGNLDQETGDEVVKILFSLVRKTGAAMLMVTHDRDLAQKCDRALSIHAGKIV